MLYNYIQGGNLPKLTSPLPHLDQTPLPHPPHNPAKFSKWSYAFSLDMKESIVVYYADFFVTSVKESLHYTRTETEKRGSIVNV